MLLDRFRAGLVPQERSRRWIFISAAFHVVLIAFLLTLKPAPRTVVQFIELEEGGRAVALPGVPAPARGTPADRRPVPPVAFKRPATPVTSDVPTAPPRGIAFESSRLDSLPAYTQVPLEPRYGDGRLWVRVSDVLAGNLPAKREAREMPSHIALVDSALAEKIRTYLDTVPPDSFATYPGPKAWTTEIAGQPWGLDGKWIYLGPIKIPATILALLPLPSGNYDLAQRNLQLQAMRDDIMQAAWRAQSAEEFKRYVKELRARKELEHQQRIPPPPPKDTLIP